LALVSEAAWAKKSWFIDGDWGSWSIDRIVSDVAKLVQARLTEVPKWATKWTKIGMFDTF
jgi:hypothetical protein